MPCTALLAQSSGSQKQSVSSIVALHMAHHCLVMSVSLRKARPCSIPAGVPGGQKQTWWRGRHTTNPLRLVSVSQSTCAERGRTCTAGCWRT